MADIIVDTYKLNQYAQRIQQVNSRISRLDGRLNSLYWKVGLLDLWNLMQADAMTSYSWRLLRCQDYLYQTASDFDNVEKIISELDPADFRVPNVGPVWIKESHSKDIFWRSSLKTAQWLFRHTTPIGVSIGMAESALTLMSSEGWKQFWDGSLEHSKNASIWSKESEDGKNYIKSITGGYSISAKPNYGSYKDKSVLGDKDHLNINKKQKQIKDKDKQVNPDEKWYKQQGTILEGKAEAKIEGSVLEGQLSGSNDWAEGSVSGKFLTGEAHASASGGLYVYTKNKDGSTTKVFSPGVSAEVGASVAVVQVEADGRIGLGPDKNMLGLYGNAEAELLTAEAKAKVAVNKNEIYAGASAEADLAKVTGTAGVSVLGTDVGVTGSLKVGVGAHAEVGYTDGKLKVDVGAAIGVGFDLGFEVDVSGTVDAVADVASSAWDGLTDVASDTWDGLTDVASDTWDGLTDVASDAWNKLFG